MVESKEFKRSGAAMSSIIRPEATADRDAIRHVNRFAFGQDVEARLVDALRDGGYVRVSLVAEKDGQVVGHEVRARRAAHGWFPDGG